MVKKQIMMMKKIVIVGLEDAILKAANVIAAAISTANGEPKFPIAGLPLPADGAGIPVKKRTVHRNLPGMSAQRIFRTYGIKQRVSTFAAVNLGIKNVGTVSNPRYALEDVDRIVAFVNEREL